MGCVHEDMITLKDYFEPKSLFHAAIKWVSIILCILFGLGTFLVNLEDMQAYEDACKSPVVVEATKSVVFTRGITGSLSYDTQLSYSYNEIHYSNVPYQSSRSPLTLDYRGEVITVAINPNNPGELMCDMFPEGMVFFAVVIWSIGLSLLIYGIAIKIETFRDWRIERANHRGFLSRLFPSSIRYEPNPDYLKDTFFILLLVFSISAILLKFLFPYVFSKVF